jgi:hypothetical protein
MEAFRPGSSRNQVERMDLAGSGFLRLVRVLRTVIPPSFSSRTIPSGRPTCSPAARVTAASEAAEEPEDLQIKVRTSQYDRMSVMQADFRQSYTALQQSVSDLQREVRVLSADPDLRERREDGPPAPVEGASPPPGPSIPILATLPRLPRLVRTVDGTTSAGGDESDVPNLDTDARTRRRRGEPIRYKFDRIVDKVTDLWTKWSLGL